MKKLHLFAAVLVSVLGVSIASAQQQEPIVTFNLNDIFSQNAAKYAGLHFTYHNILKYDGASYQPPYPYSDGRVRNGKYKASQTAMDNYIKSIPEKYNGKSFTLAKIVTDENGMPAMVMACENGDTLHFGSGTTVSAEFINADFLASEKKRVGSKIFYNGDNYFYPSIAQIQNSMPLQLTEYAFVDVKTKKNIFYLPPFSGWKISSVNFDTTYYGERNMINNGINANISRIKYVIENPTYGKFECHLQGNAQKNNFSNGLGNDEYMSSPFFQKENFSPEDLQNISTWASKGGIEAAYVNELLNKKVDDEGVNNNQEYIASKIVIDAAKKGYIYAVIDLQKAKAVSTEEKLNAIRAAEKLYGKSKILDKLYKDLGNVVFNKIYDVNKTNDPKERISIYENMISDYQLLEKNGISSFTSWNQKKIIKEQIDSCTIRINEIKKTYAEKMEKEATAKAKDEERKQQFEAQIKSQLEEFTKQIKSLDKATLQELEQHIQKDIDRYEGSTYAAYSSIALKVELNKRILKLIQDEIKKKK